ncbi:serine hydrolase, partial [Hassallia byssoidea VB512170]
MKYRYLFIPLFLPTLCFGQDANIAQTEQAKTALHQANTGKIFFTEKHINNEILAPEDFLRNYKLTHKSNLFFVAFFNNSLTNYKHQLLPEFSKDTLFKLGNYQFTIFIDNKLTYQSNLIPGAPQEKNQDVDTYLNRPFIDNENGQGTWSESFWNRFMNNGGDKLLTDGNHLLRMEIRPYVKTDSIKIGELMAAGELRIQVSRHSKIDIKNVRLNKIAPYKGIGVSNAYFDEKKIRQLKAAINEGIFKKINSVVVLKEGKILLEEYFNGEDRNSLHDPRSVGKSFVSTLIGISIKE